MGNTISRPVHHSVVLGSDGYGANLLVTSAGSIQPNALDTVALTAPSTLGAAFITNHGTIAGSKGGVMGAGGGTGILFGSAAGSLSNAGLVTGGHGGYTKTGSVGGAGGAGLLASGAPDISNTGTITGGGGGVASSYGAYGGQGGTGIDLSGAGKVTNTGLIAGGAGGTANYGFGGYGGDGVDLGAGAALDNMATIKGGQGGGGVYYGGTGGTGLALAAGAGPSANAGFIGGGHGGPEFQDYAGGPGGVGVSVGRSDVFTNTGTISGGAGGYGLFPGGSGGDGVDVLGGTLVASGLIKGGTANYSDYGGSGVLLSGGGVLMESGRVVAGSGGHDGYPGVAVNFGSGGGDAVLLAGAKIDGRFGGWSSGDTIDLRTVKASSFSYANGTLSLLNAGGHVVDTLTFAGNYTAADFALKADGSGGTDVVFGSGAADFRPALSFEGSSHTAFPQTDGGMHAMASLHTDQSGAATALFASVHAHFAL